MKSILLTEAQIEMIKEESQRNEAIQSLIFSKPEDINFKMSDGTFGIPVNRQFNTLIPIINGVEIPRNLVRLECEECNVDDELFWQLHIEVNEQLRRLGIAEKLYTSFILQGNKVVSIFTNRAATFYKEKNNTVPSDVAIENLWKKISQNPKIITYQLGDGNGNVIGITGELK